MHAIDSSPSSTSRKPISSQSASSASAILRSSSVRTPLAAPAPQSHAPALPLVNPTASAWSLSRSKRAFDVLFSLAVLALAALPMLVIALCIRITSPGPALFAQKRVGRMGQLFFVYKFRSMRTNAASSGIGLTRMGDRRITPLGRWLRRLKLDELPQFFNVLRGDMSIVGPRPKLPQYDAILNTPYRPGITGAATLAFRREEEILSRLHPALIEDFYHRHIKPLKARVDARYMCRATLASDLRLIAATAFACIAPPREPVLLRRKAARTPDFNPLAGMETVPGESMIRPS